MENKLGIDNQAQLAREEERLSKLRALELRDARLLDGREPGTAEALRFIHRYLFQDVYGFAGVLRDVDISKGNMRFASSLYLADALSAVEKMPQGDFDEAVQKYVEMNIAHPFREGNGRAMRMWLDHILSAELGCAVDWSAVDKGEYLRAMERSPICDTEIKHVLRPALVDADMPREAFMKGLDASYAYEDMSEYSASNLDMLGN